LKYFADGFLIQSSMKGGNFLFWIVL